jgi:hypothetical protein
MDEQATLLGAMAVLCTNVANTVITALVTRAQGRRIAEGNGNLVGELEIGQLRDQVRLAQSERDDALKRAAQLLKELEEVKQDLQGRNKELEEARQRVAALEGRARVYPFRQPVLLIGPRNVGKTSLMQQWHAPWNSAEVASTDNPHSCEVPVYDHHIDDAPVPGAAPDVRAPRTYHLVLKVHDFPGEVRAQQLVAKRLRAETGKLRGKSKSNLGVVIICMFDAEEAALGVRPATDEYYNGELFRELRTMVAREDIDVERVILVFNKFDLLRHHHPEKDDEELKALCVRTFAPACKLLRGSVKPRRVCEVPTVLIRGDLQYKCQGAEWVRGEAAHAMVEAFAGPDAARRVNPQPATTGVEQLLS